MAQEVSERQLATDAEPHVSVVQSVNIAFADTGANISRDNYAHVNNNNADTNANTVVDVKPVMSPRFLTPDGKVVNIVHAAVLDDSASQDEVALNDKRLQDARAKADTKHLAQQRASA